jgi:hypothetical protein
MEKKKPFKKDRKPTRKFDRTQETKGEVVYKTKETGPQKLADWQLKLKAIAICMSNQDGKIISAEVEKIYQDLIHRAK